MIIGPLRRFSLIDNYFYHNNLRCLSLVKMHQRQDVESSVLQSVARQHRRCSSSRSVGYNAADCSGIDAKVLVVAGCCLRAWYLSVIIRVLFY